MDVRIDETGRDVHAARIDNLRGRALAILLVADRGDPAVYALVASRSVEQRADVPKTLEQIVAETYADPNPFPPFNFEFGLTVFGPILLIGLAVFIIRRQRRKRRSSRMRVPRPVNRYVK